MEALSSGLAQPLSELGHLLSPLHKNKKILIKQGSELKKKKKKVHSVQFKRTLGEKRKKKERST